MLVLPNGTELLLKSNRIIQLAYLLKLIDTDDNMNILLLGDPLR